MELNEVLLFLLQLGKVAFGVGVAGLLAWPFIKKWINARVDWQFAHRLETHKHELELITENARFEYSRKLADLNLYSARKDSASATVYTALRVAHGYIAGLRGMRKKLTFEEFDSEDLTRHMTAMQVPNGMQVDIIKLWSMNKAQGIDQLQKYLRMTEVQRAEQKFEEARNLIYTNELYFSDNAINGINRFVDICTTWLYYMEYPPETAKESAERPTRAQLDAALEEIHLILRAELTHAGSATLPANAVLPLKGARPNSQDAVAHELPIEKKKGQS